MHEVFELQQVNKERVGEGVYNGAGHLKWLMLTEKVVYIVTPHYTPEAKTC